MANQPLGVRGTVERFFARKTLAGDPYPSFAGPGHTAVEVFGPRHLGRTDPFVMLMDDRLDFAPGQPVGEAHPHAGLETVTLMLEGSLDDPTEGLLQEGDLAWMTAGRGIVHNEDVRATGRARILQLWVALPSKLRETDPGLELVPLRSLPIRREPGIEARVYSGRSGAVASPTRNRVPITIVDLHLQPDARVTQELPGAHAGFAYVISGSVDAGGIHLEAGEVGWLDPTDPVETDLALRAGRGGARAILYAGEPTGEPLVQRGPFVAGSEAEIAAFHRRFRAGEFAHLGAVAHLR